MGPYPVRLPPNNIVRTAIQFKLLAVLFGSNMKTIGAIERANLDKQEMRK